MGENVILDKARGHQREKGEERGGATAPQNGKGAMSATGGLPPTFSIGNTCSSAGTKKRKETSSQPRTVCTNHRRSPLHEGQEKLG